MRSTVLKLKLFTGISALLIAALGVFAVPATSVPSVHEAADMHGMQAYHDCLNACAANNSHAPAPPAAVLVHEEKEEEQETDPTLPPDPSFFAQFTHVTELRKIVLPSVFGAGPAPPPDLVTLYSNLRI